MRPLTQLASAALRYTLACGLVTTGLAAMASPVVATFSYDLTGGHTITGSVTGNYQDQGDADARNDYIDSITGIVTKIDGIDLRGPLFLSAYDSGGRRDDLASRLYLNVGFGANVGFIIANCATLAECIQASNNDYNYFVLRTGNTPYGSYFDKSGGSTVSYNNYVTYDSPYWTISTQAVTAPPQHGVPEPGALALVMLGLAGSAVARRRG